MMRPTPAAAALLAALTLAACWIGCARQPAPSARMSRVDSMIKRSGGDWNKLTPEDRDYLIREIGKGSPISAQMTFNARAGRLAPGAQIRH